LPATVTRVVNGILYRSTRVGVNRGRSARLPVRRVGYFEVRMAHNGAVGSDALPARVTSAHGRSLWREMTRRSALTGYLFILPSLLILGAFVFWPIIQAFILSLYHWQFGTAAQEWAGAANYQRMVVDDRVWNAFRNTVIYTAVTVPASMLISLLLALALNERLPARSLLRSVIFLPVIASFAIIAIVWSFMLDPDIGLLAYWSKSLGLPVSGWLRDPTWALPAVMMVSIWKTVGFDMVIFLAGLQGIPEVFYEAAKVDGASAWQRFRHVTLPMLRPTTLFVLVISVIGAFQVFDPVYVMTPGGGPLHSTETVVSYIYHEGIELIDISYAAGIGVLLFVIVFVLTLIQLRALRFREVY
jgi:multiple sugar transport system permease protein